MSKAKRVLIALMLAVLVLVGGVGPLDSAAMASHNPTVGCWFEEWTDYGDPWYGPHWGYYPDYGGWWYYQRFVHYENCEDGWQMFYEIHDHWYGPY